MLTNYDEGIRKLESVAHDWKHKYLTICGKITVIKTFMLSVLSHVATVLPTPPNVYCKKIEKIMSDYIRGEREQSEPNNKIKLRPSIISQDVLFAPQKNNGLGLQRVSTFWAAIKLGWLRRLGKKSFWKSLHLKDKTPMFDPHNSNEVNIKKAIKNVNNPMMKQIYIYTRLHTGHIAPYFRGLPPNRGFLVEKQQFALYLPPIFSENPLFFSD